MQHVLCITTARFMYYYDPLTIRVMIEILFPRQYFILNKM